ncbi:ATP-binding protein [Ancylothrix sp. C2]|nr:ATP-binding protein [Ancylothrix sp. D3o]
MTSSADFDAFLAAQPPLTPAKNDDSQGLRCLGAELAFTHDLTGVYLSFDWLLAGQYDLDPAEIVGRSMAEIFGPVAVSPYLERVQRVSESLMPERFSYPFYYGEKYFLFDLVVSPILRASEELKTVLVMGRLLSQQSRMDAKLKSETEAGKLSLSLDLHQKLLSEIVGSMRRTLPPAAELYQKLLSKIARNIRRTLDLQTICQQTVSGLGQALSASRCVICVYKNSTIPARVVAEYSLPGLSSLLGVEVPVLSNSCLQNALSSRDVSFEESVVESIFDEKSLLAIATCYQDRPNGLICLIQCDQTRTWSPAEIEFLRELADQVGTAIAHATLYQELEVARAAAEEASRLKSEFLANTSHELRTPLNGIIGFLKLIMDGMADDPEEEEEFLQEAYHAALHLLNLINDVLDLAKIEAGKMQLDFGPVKLGELLSAAEDLTRAQIQQKQLYFKVYKPANYEGLVLWGNYQRLLQVMLNLVGNAIKFTNEGGVTVYADVIRQKIAIKEQEFPGMVRVRVCDTGIGVALDKQHRLFQSFSQVDSSRTRQYGGTGLGLAISQKLIEAMGGGVNFYSSGEGLGSTVTFTVPLYEEPPINWNMDNIELPEEIKSLLKE